MAVHVQLRVVGTAFYRPLVTYVAVQSTIYTMLTYLVVAPILLFHAG